MKSLRENTKMTRVLDAVAAGTTDQTGTIVDMSGFEGVEFVVMFGAIATDAVTSIKVQTGAQSDLSDAADLAGTSISIGTTDDNKAVRIDVYKPLERYARVYVDRGTGNATIDGAVALQYGPAKAATTDDSTTCVTGETHASPAEGTA